MLDRRRIAQDRRQSGRLPCVFAVKSVAGTRVQLGQAEDVGPAGMTLRRPRGLAFRPMTPLSLTFELPGSEEQIAAVGVVVSDVRIGSWRRTGVRFARISPEHARHIAAYVERNARRARGEESGAEVVCEMPADGSGVL